MPQKKIAENNTYVSIPVFIAGWRNIPMYRVDVVRPASKIG